MTGGASEPVRVAAIGVGDIGAVYLRTIAASPMLNLVAVGSRDGGKARDLGATHGVRGITNDALLRDDEVELVLNLTPAHVHDELNLRIVSAGKHLYSEKPFALGQDAFQRINAIATASRLLVGSAPDTFFGAGHQAARRLIDDNTIGQPVFGTTVLGHPGVELFHPRPDQFYQPGGEIPNDIGPYHIVQWVNLLGPVERVYCRAAHGVAARTAHRGSPAGRSFAVNVPTSFSIVLEFAASHAQLLFSLDVPAPIGPHILLTGTAGALRLPDPNFFGDKPVLVTRDEQQTAVAIEGRPFGAPTGRDHAGRCRADYRGAGLVDLALCIREGGEPRTGGRLLAHITDILSAIRTAWTEGLIVELTTSCARPAPLGSLDRDRRLAW